MTDCRRSNQINSHPSFFLLEVRISYTYLPKSNFWNEKDIFCSNLKEPIFSRSLKYIEPIFQAFLYFPEKLPPSPEKPNFPNKEFLILVWKSVPYNCAKNYAFQTFYTILIIMKLFFSMLNQPLFFIFRDILFTQILSLFFSSSLERLWYFLRSKKFLILSQMFYTKNFLPRKLHY